MIVTSNYLDLVGRTPVVEVPQMSPNPKVRIFLKLEGFNASGSIKDRAALYMVREARQSGGLRPGKTILEASSGNLAIALAMIGRREGYPVTIVAPQSITEERKLLLRFYGVRMIYTDGPTTKDSIECARRLADKDESYCFLYQYANPMNPLAHYETTGPEIIAQCPEVDVLVCGFGSSGTLMGAGRRLKEYNERIRVIAVEPYPGSSLPGLRNIEEDAYIPPIFDPDLLDGRFLVSGEAAHSTIKALANKEGLFIGMSAGAVVHTAIRLATRMERGTIVAVLADAGWKYMSIGICEETVTGEAGDNVLKRAW